MPYSNHRGEEEENIFSMIMGIIRWAHRNGGVSLIFIVAGISILMFFSFFVTMGMTANYIILILGIVLVAIGYYDHKRQLKVSEMKPKLQRQ